MLTIATYNIASYRKPDIEKQRLLCEKNNIDIIGLQEVDVDAERTPYNIPELYTKEHFADSYFSKTVNLAPGEYGNAIISRFPMLEKSAKQFKKIEGIDEPRLYQRVVIEKDAVKIAIYNTHLSYENIEGRHTQLVELKEAFEADPIEHKIIVGDFNVDQEADELDLMKDYQIVNNHLGFSIPTFQEEDQTMKIFTIDYIITTNNFTPHTFSVVQSDLSDHSLVLSTLEINSY